MSYIAQMIEQLTIKQAIKRYSKSDSTIRRLLRDMSEEDKDKYLSTDDRGRNLISSLYLDNVYNRQPIQVVNYQSSDDQVVEAIKKFSALAEQYSEMAKLQQEAIIKAEERHQEYMAKLDQMTKELIKLNEMKSMSKLDSEVESVTDSKKSKKANKKKEKTKKRLDKKKSKKKRKKKNKDLQVNGYASWLKQKKRS